MKIYLARQFPNGSAEKCMKIYLAKSGVLQQAYFTKDNMNIFLAGGEGQLRAAIQDQKQDLNIYKDANILQSFYYCNNYTEKVIIPQCKSFMLDSGAFTFRELSKKVDWNEYVERYAEFINRNNVELFFELDIDNLVGYSNVLILRNKLEKLTNKQSIPVWHKTRGKDDFLHMCEEYQYVAIGGIAGKNKSSAELKKLHETFPWLIREAHRRGTRIHGLGYTSLSGLKKYHFDSVDSTAWVSGNQFGAVYRFTGDSIERVIKQKNQRVKTSATAINNFVEWKKFATWAEVNL